MNPYLNEDVMWQRLKDLQLEAENRRLMRSESGGTGAWDAIKMLAARAWLLAGLATRRPPRRGAWVDAHRNDASARVA